MLDQRRRRWADFVEMLFKMFCVCWVGSSATSGEDLSKLLRRRSQEVFKWRA